MKILYAVQSTGNGHICRAQKLVPALRQYADVDVLTSGTAADISLGFPIKYHYRGFGFVFGTQGGIQWSQTIFRNKPIRLCLDIATVPVTQYDLVINDFEPVTAWACKRKNVPCIAMSHQYALLAEVPKPPRVPAIIRWVLNHYAPAQRGVGFHFKRYAPHIFFPIIRDAVRNQKTSKENSYTVYLPAYADSFICSILTQIPQTQWEVFSKHCTKAYSVENVNVQPPSGTAFQASMAKATGVLCGAGFETPAEAMFLKKKLLIIPMRDQYEQHYNAAALENLDIPVLSKLSKHSVPKLAAWVNDTAVPNIDFPDDTNAAIDYLLSLAAAKKYYPIFEKKAMETIFHPANSRGSADHGWLQAKHSFSFAGWFNPERTQFGALRVLNDDIVQGGMGFGTHPHDNMEIITIPLKGDLEHRDSMGNVEVIREGEIQVMSAGTGVYHSEYNKNADWEINLLQLWIFPNKRNVTPRYDQIPIDSLHKKNEPFQILSPNPDDQGVWIHQNAWFHMLDLEAANATYYDLKLEGNGVYAFVIDGEVEIGEHVLGKRDALAISEIATFEITAHQDTQVLLIEVPMVVD